jgi:hypothetical protein
MASASQVFERVRQADPKRIDELLVGAVDLHIHSGPSVMPRALNHIDMMRAAQQARMRAILFKDHYYTTAPVAALMREEFRDTSVEILSSIVLNNASGGFNPYAVDHALKLGARIVWMPTSSAANHIRQGHRKIRLRTKIPMLPPTALQVVDDRGVIIDSVKQILDQIAAFDCILSAGHLHISELWPLFTEAKARGVSRLLVNHPTYVLGAELSDITELVGMGAKMEHSICMFIDCRSRKYEPDDLKAMIEAAGADNTFFGSDLGQVNNPEPVEGFRQIIALLLELGYSDADIRKMTGDNGFALAGLGNNTPRSAVA